jgi:hypothetical protein
MKPYRHLWRYLAEFFLEWEKFQTKVVEKIKTHFTFNNFFFRKPCRLWDNVEKYGTAGQATDGNITRRKRFAFRLTKAVDTHSEYVTLILYHDKNRYANASQCHVLRTLPLLCVCVVQVAASATGWSLMQRSPTGCVCVCVCV